MRLVHLAAGVAIALSSARALTETPHSIIDLNTSTSSCIMSTVTVTAPVTVTVTTSATASTALPAYTVTTATPHNIPHGPFRVSVTPSPPAASTMPITARDGAATAVDDKSTHGAVRGEACKTGRQSAGGSLSMAASVVALGAAMVIL